MDCEQLLALAWDLSLWSVTAELIFPGGAGEPPFRRLRSVCLMSGQRRRRCISVEKGLDERVCRGYEHNTKHIAWQTLSSLKCNASDVAAALIICPTFGKYVTCHTTKQIVTVSSIIIHIIVVTGFLFGSGTKDGKESMGKAV